MLDEAQPVALVTGASRGIGKAIALELVSQNLTVIGTATSDIGADNISGYLREAGGSGEGIRADVSDETSVANLIKSINDRFCSPTILVNNASVISIKKELRAI